MTEPFTAQTPEQARLLLREEYQTVLEPLMSAALGVAEVARATRLDLKTAHRRVARLHAAGLVTVEAERARSGRAVKVYRAAAQRYTVPFALTDAQDISALMHSAFTPALNLFLERVARQFRRREVGGDVTVNCDAHGQLSANIGTLRPLDGSTLGGFGTFADRRLGPESRRELERRLREVQAWAAERAAEEQAQPDARACLLGLLLATED